MQAIQRVFRLDGQTPRVIACVQHVHQKPAVQIHALQIWGYISILITNMHIHYVLWPASFHGVRP